MQRKDMLFILALVFIVGAFSSFGTVIIKDGRLNVSAGLVVGGGLTIEGSLNFSDGTTMSSVADADDASRTHVLLNSLRIADVNTLSIFTLDGGRADAFEDATGIDASASSSEVYNSSDGFYSGFGAGSIDSDTKLLLHMDGTNGGTTFTDASASGHVVTAYGNAVTSTAQIQFGVSSGYFDGAGDYLSMPNSADWNFGSGNFTVDLWMRSSSFTSQTFFLSASANDLSDGWALGYYNSESKIVFYYHNGGFTDVSPIQALSLNTWYHIAAVRNGNTMYFFVNGNLIGSPFDIPGQSITDTSSPLVVGDYTNQYGNRYFNGYIDEIRISKGIARWTSNFAFPTMAYPLDVLNDISLVSNSFEASSEPVNSKLVVLMQNVSESVTLNTDIKAYVSLDDGANWEQVTLTELGAYDSTTTILTGSEPLTDLNDQTMRWNITTHNTKDIRIKGVGFSWG